jgi:TatD DNase family protein
MLLHDTHVHLEMLLDKSNISDNKYRSLDNKLYSQIDLLLSEKERQFIDNALINHEFVVQSTVSTQNYLLLSHLFKDNPKVHYLIGSHPELVTSNFSLSQYLADQEQTLNQINIKNLAGIGEVGLDYFYTKDSNLIALQKELFCKQIELALKLNLPLIIHCREAFADLFTILDQYPNIHGRFLIHCFTGDITEAKEVQKRGGLIGIGGIITYDKTEKLQEAVKYMPMENIVIESDLPFLSPQPHRKLVCQPSYIQFTINKIGQIKNIDPRDVILDSQHNSIIFFPSLNNKYGKSGYNTAAIMDYNDYTSS